jgi:hypothetical protein
MLDGEGGGMKASFQARYTTVLSAFALLALASGCQNKALPAACTCVGDITIKVNHGHARGVDKKAVYLCSGYKITWEIESGSNDKEFTVEFVGPDLPFGPSATIFNSSNGTASTGPLAHFSELTVFKYKITIKDSNNSSHPFDPHIIGGG